MPTEDRDASSPLLAEVFRAFDRAGVRYCLLRSLGGRGEDTGPARLREADLLVDSRDLGRFGVVARELGFAPLASWGHGGHRFFVAYEEHAGAWLKLDVVTRLRYGGPTRPFATKVLDGCLERRQRGQGASGDGTPHPYVPEPPDAVLGLLLHCVLDKRRFKDDHRAELARLQRNADSDGALREHVARRLDAALGRALPWDQASPLIAAGRWEHLLQRRRRIARELFAREPVGCARRWLGGGLMRRLRPLLIALRRRGLTVALLGPDGAGKTSLAAALAEDPQIRARIVYMGSNPDASTVGLPSTRWIEGLRRDRTRRRAGVLGGIAFLNRLLEQGYRSLIALGWKLRGRFVVFDRHPLETVASAGSGPGPRARRWLLHATCLRPDLVVLLDAPAAVLQARKGEEALTGLEKQRQRYRARTFSGMDCLRVDAGRPQEAVWKSAKAALWARYAQRHLKTAAKNPSRSGRTRLTMTPASESRSTPSAEGT